MAGHTYVANVYSNYPDVWPQEGTYVNGPNHHENWYMVETTIVERYRVPSNGYNNFDGGYNFSGVPLKNNYRKEYIPQFMPQVHHENYEHNNGSDDENVSPPYYHERENLMNNFLKKLQIGASRPVKTGNFLGPNKYRPTSPNKYRSKSPTYGDPSRKPDFIQAQYLPAPNRYRPISPTKYQPLSPNKYHSTSPEKYRPISPTKYRPSWPTNNQTTSRENYGPTSPITYRPTSPTKYRPISPTKYQPANITKFQHANSGKYQPTSPTHNYPSKENHMFTAQNLQDPNNNQHTNPIHHVPSTEIQPIRTQRTDPNKIIPLSPVPDNDRDVTADDFSVPNKHWQSPSQPAPHKPLTTPTSDINEALSSLTESVNNTPRAQADKSDKRFGWNALGTTARRFMKSDTIDSKEAIKKYNGVHVP